MRLTEDGIREGNTAWLDQVVLTWQTEMGVRPTPVAGQTSFCVEAHHHMTVTGREQILIQTSVAGMAWEILS
jgi:hypothetical protein